MKSKKYSHSISTKFDFLSSLMGSPYVTYIADTSEMVLLVSLYILIYVISLTRSWPLLSNGRIYYKKFNVFTSQITVQYCNPV